MEDDLGLTVWALSDCDEAHGAEAQGRVSKVKIARRLRNETTMSLKWIAQRLQMGSVSMVAHCLK